MEFTNAAAVGLARMDVEEGTGGAEPGEMVARDGLEPPTPAFSGPRSTN